ncbi:ABC transporter permease [Phycicoccus flavus]|uniref:ABC transporter permease n=1 Tax=Phycicoccus flavus TaxID=2502783 RepID=A0A8T6QZE8_9MICO|nr:ABC transporter permease [Phycicoccus flavus]NHA67489.1 ABC transporter permease [Phycicoccus flavus]
MNILFEWFGDPANWSGADGIGQRLWEHLWYTAVTMLVASAVALPLGLWVGHTGRGRWLVTLANSARAVPTLGLLLAASLWLGPKLPGDFAYTVPSIAVLAILAVPPLLAGAYGGIDSVDGAARDAAYGVGMRGRQVLWQVEVPNALPLMLSGVRSAVLQVVATATIAAIPGLGGLGRFIIDGIALADYGQAGGGALLVAVLAVLLEGILALLQRRLVSPGLTGRAVGGSRNDDDSAGPEESADPTVDLRTSV